MNPHRIIPTIALAATLICNMVAAAESDRHFMRAVGTLSLSNAQVHTLISVVKSTNALPVVSVTWQPSHAADSLTMPMTHSGWFVFAELPTRIWVFDGDSLSLLEQSDTSVSNSSNPEAFKSCPVQVREALPEKIRKRYFK